jgi:hypothetical protein
MIELHESGGLSACPNTICYTAVINSCAYCENDDMEKREALRIAIGTYKDLENSRYGSPNHVTYSNLLTALRNLLPISQKRSVAIQDVFLSAVKNGYVDQVVVQRVKCKFVRESCVEIPSDFCFCTCILTPPYYCTLHLSSRVVHRRTPNTISDLECR